MAIHPLRLGAPWRWLLRPLGVRPGRAEVEIDDERLEARYGVLGIETPVDNVVEFRLTGPYRWWKAIGPRGSLADYGFTFGTSTHGGVCLCFGEPIPFRMRGGAMESLTVTVDDVDALADELRAHGIPGKDERRGR